MGKICLTDEQREAIASYSKKRLFANVNAGYSSQTMQSIRIKPREVHREAPKKLPQRDCTYSSRLKEQEESLGKMLDYLLDGASRGNTAKKVASEKVLRAISPDVSTKFLAEYVQKYDFALESYRKVRQSPLALATQNLANIVDEGIEQGKEALNEFAKRTQRLLSGENLLYNLAHGVNPGQ